MFSREQNNCYCCMHFKCAVGTLFLLPSNWRQQLIVSVHSANHRPAHRHCSNRNVRLRGGSYVLSVVCTECFVCSTSTVRYTAAYYNARGPSVLQYLLLGLPLFRPEHIIQYLLCVSPSLHLTEVTSIMHIHEKRHPECGQTPCEKHRMEQAATVDPTVQDPCMPWWPCCTPPKDQPRRSTKTLVKTRQLNN